MLQSETYFSGSYFSGSYFLEEINQACSAQGREGWFTPAQFSSPFNNDGKFFSFHLVEG